MPLIELSQGLMSKRFPVTDSSMEPTLQRGSHLQLSPLSFMWRIPRRGEVIALKSPQHEQQLEFKRIVGLPGENVSWNGSDLWINGIRQYEPYLQAVPNFSGEKPYGLGLGPGEYFVAGDNRLNSRDSRFYGPVFLSDILGLVIEIETHPLANHTCV
jgi:signal peptidase I